MLMGLPETPSAELLTWAARGAGSLWPDTAVHWLEADALQLACVHAHLRAAVWQLRVLPTFTQPAHDAAGADAVRALAAAARALVQSSTRLARSGRLAEACARAADASVHAREAVRHPALLAVDELPPDWWHTTWPPLFFPIATAVASALLAEVRQSRTRRPQK
jgi:hypothetical protein